MAIGTLSLRSIGPLRPAALAALAALSLAGCSGGGGDPFAEAQAALAKHDYAAARVLLSQAVDAEPQDLAIRLAYARTLLIMGNADGAIAQLDHFADGLAQVPEAVALLGKAHLLLGRPERALEVFTQHGLETGAAYAIACAANLEMGDAGAANALLEQGLAAFPQDVDLMVLAAQRAYDLRDMAASQDAIARALALQTDHPDALRLAGRIAMHERDLDTAEGHFRNVLKVLPWDLPAHLALAAIARDQGKEEEASDWIAKAHEAAPGNPVSAYFAAQMAFEDGDMGAAQQMLSTIRPETGDFPALWRLRGKISAEQGNTATAMTEFERFFRTGGEAADARFDLARLYLGAGKQEEAWDVLSPSLVSADAPLESLQLGRELAVKLGKSDGARLERQIALAAQRLAYDSQLRDADAAMRAGDWAKADTIYAALIKGAAVSDPVVLNNAANVRLQMGDASGGRDLARKAYALEPEDPFVLDTLGWAIMQAEGRTSEAVRLIERAYALDPNNPEIAEHRLVMAQESTN